jgi:hypothetical protein
MAETEFKYNVFVSGVQNEIGWQYEQYTFR